MQMHWILWWVLTYSISAVSVSGQPREHHDGQRREERLLERTRGARRRETTKRDRRETQTSSTTTKSAMGAQAAFLGQMLSQQAKGVTPNQAAILFQNFKVLETTKSYKSFLATGSTDPAKKAAAQVGSVQDFMKMTGAVGTKLIAPGGLNATMAQFVKEADNDPKLRKLVEDVASGADKSANHRLQQAFADKYMGGIDLDTLYDNDWVDKTRAQFLGDKDLKRILGDTDVMKVLSNPMLKLKRPDQVTAKERDELIDSLRLT